MDEKELKTSPKQRFFIITITVIMLGSIIASYAAIIINGGSNTSTTTNNTISEEKRLKYEAEYEAKLAEYQAATKNDYDTLAGYKTEIAAFNETAANSNGVQSRDLKDGTGHEISDDNPNYLAYYVGYCADETVFDSSFDNNDNPTSFKPGGVLDLSQMSLIEGWYVGMDGAKVGGVREITIPSELAYGDSEQACGANKPLRFIVLTKEVDDELLALDNDLQIAYMKYQYAVYYGVDYEEVVKSAE